MMNWMSVLGNSDEISYRFELPHHWHNVDVLMWAMTGAFVGLKIGNEERMMLLLALEVIGSLWLWRVGRIELGMRGGASFFLVVFGCLLLNAFLLVLWRGEGLSQRLPFVMVVLGHLDFGQVGSWFGLDGLDFLLVFYFCVCLWFPFRAMLCEG